MQEYMTRHMVARRSMTYAEWPLQPGDEFRATPHDAEYFKRNRWAEDTAPPAVVEVAPVAQIPVAEVVELPEVVAEELPPASAPAPAPAPATKRAYTRRQAA